LDTTCSAKLDVLVGEFGDVHEAFDAVGDATNAPKGHQLGDSTGSDLTDCVGAGEYLPGVFLGGLERQRDALAVHVDLENLNGDFLANLNDFAGVVDVLPADSSET
jgi:hypothetical protein